MILFNKKIVVLISDSGTGTNLNAIINGVKSGKIKADILSVISDTSKALGLKWARKNKIPTQIAADKNKLLQILRKLSPD
ncbi:MAG: Phosphoribosyl-glycinamide transformylase, catalyzes a step in the 'de novo' purine nucleotide biosy, partial [Parcubacteria group bacterium GW2011_GWF2_39_8b]